MPDDILAAWPLAPASEADWLADLAQDDGLTGYEAPGRPDAAWVLGGMYERGEAAEDSLNHEQSRDEHPGPGWQRLRWAELAARIGDPVVPQGLYPCYHCFPSAKEAEIRPGSIEWPAEGSLDRPTWDQLIRFLTEHSPQGTDTPCLAYYNPIIARDFEIGRVRFGRLGDAQSLFDNPEIWYTPSNLWAADHSWVVCTDYDLWGTKVCGPHSLVEALLTDPELEAVRLPWTS
ncbi:MULTISPECIES: hypothetical protein [unclassified Streptomyces]|uniref:hypothetical protein n=1 Tax=unclassified Streptomyces TaxID=2593676 RepID=UPI000DB9AD59|nr:MULTISPECIES: hypothetical protein [unclassified Streptomyces]MYT68204.1 hypothetical protein [Streptomyces sp. SID8367]RAJ76832.1 hypothetical protein K377_06000 [Streptomyces sp. PsTaAH-137]